MAKAKIVTLSESDVKLLQGLLTAAKTGKLRLEPRRDTLWSHGEDQSAPEVYVAKPVDGTIPPLTVSDTVGTGTGTGTAANCDVYDSPGYAQCYIYEVVDTTDCGQALIPIEDREETVYNLSMEEIDPDDGYIPVFRDKFGKWLTSPVSGGGSDVVSFCCGAFSQGASVMGAVEISDVAGVNQGDAISVSDPAGEFYNTSGHGYGWAIRVGGAWYMLRMTCPDFDASAACTGTGTGTGTGT